MRTLTYSMLYICNICRTDIAIILYGKTLWAKSVKRETASIKGDMRKIGNLLDNFRVVTGNEEMSVEDLLNYSNFENFEKKLWINNLEERTSLKLV